MDLINSLADSVDISKVSVKTTKVFEDIYERFGDWVFMAFNSSKQLQELLPKLVEECGDVDAYDEWEPKDYLNFKDFVITPQGIRGLTDGFWSWGVAFSYDSETGILHIDLRCENHKGLTTEITDLPEEVKAKMDTYFGELITKNPYGLVVTLDGYLVLDESSYVR